MTVDTQILKGADLFLTKLRLMPREVVSKRGGPVKRALRRGALLIAAQAQENLRNTTARPDADGYESTGTLAASVVVRRDPHPQRSGASERYRILVARRRYPDGKTRTVATGRYLEYGTEYRAPTPWLQPAYFAKRQEALDTVINELRREIDRYWKKHG